MCLATVLFKWDADRVDRTDFYKFLNPLAQEHYLEISRRDAEAQSFFDFFSASLRLCAINITVTCS